jgi:hypothetical protein
MFSDGESLAFERSQSSTLQNLHACGDDDILHNTASSPKWYAISEVQLTELCTAAINTGSILAFYWPYLRKLYKQ